MTRCVLVAADDARTPCRLDAFLRSLLPSCSRRVLARVIAEGAVRVNGRQARKGTMVRAGDRVTFPDLPTTLAPEPECELRILHEDAWLVAADKPAGMPSHAIEASQRGTAAAALLARYPEMAGLGDRLASGLVHRLDTGTSGLLLAARTASAHSALREAFRRRDVEKRYLAVTEADRIAWRRTDIRVPLAHDPRNRRRMQAASPGLRAWPAETQVEVLAMEAGRALLAATIRTGVTHQVRAHLALLGHPVLNDPLYGGPPVPELPAGRHALHAARLTLPHPATGRPLVLESPLPADLRRVGPLPP